MKISWNGKPLVKLEADVVAVRYSRAAGSAFVRLDELCGGALERAAQREGVSRKSKGPLVWQGEHAGWSGRVIASVEGTDTPTRKGLRATVAKAVELCGKTGGKTLELWLDGADVEASAQLAAQTALLCAYRFTKYKTKDIPARRPVLLRIGSVRGVGRGAKVRRAIELGVAMAEAVCIARDLVNEPASALGPQELCGQARALAKKAGLSCKVLSADVLKTRGMGLILGVAAASPRPPCLVHLTYRPKTKPTRKIALIGKGITFDTGGLCLKQPRSMEEMKTDMAGAAAVLAAMSCLAQLEVRAEVHGILPITDNALGGAAMRPSDVLRSASGLTVEVMNTDAEGRLILADALTYAAALSPSAIVDVATLTGSCTVALGEHCAGLFGNDDGLAKAFLDAADAAMEPLWRLPLLEDLEIELSSDVADLKNVGTRTYGGAILAALFLRRFVGAAPWLHLDIAGPARAARATPLCPKGGTGYGVLCLLEYLKSL